MTVVGRSQIDHPALGAAGGTALHAQIENIYTNIGNNLSGRYKPVVNVANSTLSTIEHNFGAPFSDLNVMLYSGTFPNLVRIEDPAAAGWIIIPTPTFEKTKINITTPPAGGPFTFTMFIVQGGGAETFSELKDIDFSVAPTDGQYLIYDSASAKWKPLYVRYAEETATIATNTITPVLGKNLQRVTGAASDIQMIAGPNAGELFVLVNETGSDITIKNNTGATAANRILTGTGIDFTFKNGSAVTLLYNSGLTRWMLTGGGGGGGLQPTFVSAGPVTAQAGFHYLTDTTAGGFTINLPAGTTGATIRITDSAETWATNNLTVNPFTGQKIDQLSVGESLLCDVVRGWVQLDWTGTYWSFNSLASTQAIEASAGNAGIVSTGTQSFSGVKTYNDGLKVDDAAGQSTLAYYREDDTTLASCTFQGNLGGPPSAGVAIKITRVGRIVTVDIPTFTGVVTASSSVSIISNTALPTWARPGLGKVSYAQAYNIAWINTGLGVCLVAPTGIISFYLNLANTAYANGAAGWYDTQITYSI